LIICSGVYPFLAI